VSRALKVGVDGGPYALALGPDEAMWVTLVHAGAIARVTDGGDVTVYPVDARSRPSIIAAGPDGAMWFTEFNADQIGRITTAGQIKEFAIDKFVGPDGIVTGRDGALWFAEFDGGNAIGRITTDGRITHFPMPHPNSNPDDRVRRLLARLQKEQTAA